MRIGARICSVLSWVAFVIGLFMQGLLLYALSLPAAKPENRAALPWVAIGTAVFAAGFLLLRFCKKRRVLWGVLMAVGAVALFAVGQYLQVWNPETIEVEGISRGYTSFAQFASRHLLPGAAALLQGVAAFMRARAEDKELFDEAMKEIKTDGPQESRFE